MAKTLTDSQKEVEQNSESSKILRNYSIYLQQQCRLSERTVEAYVDVIRRLLSHGDIQSGSIRSFLREAATSLSSSSQAQWSSALKKFIQWGTNENILKDPERLLKEIIRPKVRQKIVNIVDEEDLQLLQKMIETRPNLEKILFALLYAAGLRISEALNVNPQNLIDENHAILIQGKGAKTRRVPIFGFLQSQLITAKLEGKTSIWNQKTSVRTLRKLVENWGNFSLLTERTGRLHPHKLRHSIASHLLKRGAGLEQIQKFLGHQQLSTTQRYTHVNIDDLIKVYDQSFPKLKRGR